MGSGVSRGKKSTDENVVNILQVEETTCSSCQAKESQRKQQQQQQKLSRPLQVEAVQRQVPENTHYFNNDIDRPGVPRASHGNTTKRFYYYPRRGDDAQNETLYVANSQFPFTKPKAVPVRPRQMETCAEPPKRNVNQLNNFPSVNSNLDHGRYPKLQNDMKNSGLKSYQYINDRHWSVPNVISTEDYAHEKIVLPHKTVVELRRSSQIQPYGRHYNYTCDLPINSFATDLGCGRKRPPTPVPTDWFPAQRTDDYLVASSLLAMEQRQDRLRNEKMDMHDF